MNKSGIQAQLADPAFKAMVEATLPYCLKVLDGARDLPLVNRWALRRMAMGGGVLILRHVTGDDVQIADLPAMTKESLRLFEGWRALAAGGITVVLELPINEKFHTDLGQFADLAEASVPAAEAIHEAGFRAGVLVTSEGNPPGDNYGAAFFLQPRVLACLRRFRQLGSIWCPHGYSHPPADADEAWHFDRPRHILAQLPEDARLNYAFGEMGCDGGCDLPEKKPGVGWQGYFGPDEGRIKRYADYARGQVARIAQDPLCVAGAFFLSGHDPAGRPNFSTFDVRDEVDFRPVLTENVPGPATTWLSTTPSTPPISGRPSAQEKPVSTTPGATSSKEAPMAQVKLIDISNWQHYPDLAKVKAAGYGGVIVKVSEDDYGDDDFYDPYAAGNWKNAGDVGMVRGIYTFVRPSKSSPAESVKVVENAIVKIGGLQVGDFVAMDIEDELVPVGVSLHVWTAEGLALLEEVLGFPPGKYSGKWYTETRDLEHDDLERWWTWWAAYQASKPAGTVGWRPIRIWQFSAHAIVPGVEGECDVNVFDGTLDDLRALGRPLQPLVWTSTPAIPADVSGQQASADRSAPGSSPGASSPVVTSVPAEVTAALDWIWSAIGPDVATQMAVIAIKEKLGLQKEVA